MAYGTGETLIQWTNKNLRNPYKYVITTYLNNVTVDTITVYTEDAMQNRLGVEREKANRAGSAALVDQIKVVRYPVTVPSATPDT